MSCAACAISGKVIRACPKSWLLARLRRVEEWRKSRFIRLLDDNSPDAEKRVCAAKLYIEAGARRMAVELALME